MLKNYIMIYSSKSHKTKKESYEKGIIPMKKPNKKIKKILQGK
jgi:hypothetical protein